jgi:hypothetical protein
MCKEQLQFLTLQSDRHSAELSRLCQRFQLQQQQLHEPQQQVQRLVKTADVRTTSKRHFQRLVKQHSRHQNNIFSVW